MSKPILKISNLSTLRDEPHKLTDINLMVEKGQAVGLLGPNGAGKKSLLTMISANSIRYSGSVLYQGQDISNLSGKERFEMGIINILRNNDGQFEDDASCLEHLARAVKLSPELIILDEPFKDIQSKLEHHCMVNLIKQLNSMGVGILLSDHNVTDAMKLVDMIYILSEGRILTQGNPPDGITFN